MGIRENLKAKMVEKLGKSESEITDEARFVEDLGADSLDVMDFIMEIETEYNIKIPASDAETLKTFGSLVAYLEEHVGK